MDNKEIMNNIGANEVNPESKKLTDVEAEKVTGGSFLSWLGIDSTENLEPVAMSPNIVDPGNGSVFRR